MRRAAAGAFAVALLASVPVLAQVVGGDPTDPARNLPLACELVNNPALGAVVRSEKNIEHLANRCGIVGTDVEFQSRKDSRGRMHDYAFVGTMGFGFQIYDVTNPENPQEAGGSGVSGWQNDVQVRGNLALATFDGVSGEPSTTSTCLKTKFNPLTANDQGIDVFTLAFNPVTAKFAVNLKTCVANPPGGTHNATLHPGGKWIGLANCCSDWAIDVVDLTKTRADNGTPPVTYRFIDQSRRATAGKCPPPDQPQLVCVVVNKPDGTPATGLWRPHDISFSYDGKTAYVAALNSTFIVDVSRVLSGQMRTIAIIPNADPDADPSHDIELSHQADPTPDGSIVVVSDEKGGGTSNTQCNTTPGGTIGGLHFFALRRIQGVPQSNGASPSTPKKLGTWIYPLPLDSDDPLAPFISALNRTERGCTVHVFRIGGNGTAGPGPIAQGFDGVSRLSDRQLATAHYGAGVWWMDFSRRSNPNDGMAEDPRSTWGNTLGWNIMAGADTWSAKEYKGHIYAGDMLRGFDVYRFTEERDNDSDDDGDDDDDSDGDGDDSSYEGSNLTLWEALGL